ncbi:outer membrane lipid asymmetry maintenance protein MlaD [Thioclava sp. FR2]|uniref:outer membrane lipid asymmetry maintenance protein MlaD n=1 Tax=Thioclava sp. FR2 TaxID=3445780 RepID=UPI003EBBD9B6
MTSERSEILAGAAVLLVAAGFLYFASQTAGLKGASASYPVKASFRAVDGITVGSDVRLAGLKVGTITGLELNPQTYFADAEIEIQNSVQIPVDSAILISSEGLLGGNYVEIMPGGSLENLSPGDEIEDTQGSVSLVNLLMKFVGSGGEGAGTEEATP